MDGSADFFIAHVAGHAGIPAAEADAITRRVLSGLGAHLSEAYRELVAAELPAALAEVVLAGRGLAVPIEEGLVASGLAVGHAHELIASVCRVLAEELSARTLLVMRATLPIQLARLLEPPSRELTGAPAAGRPDTLAGGRPGSQHPISDTPTAGAQVGSVGEVNPHGGSKLSSTAGTTQERRHETLAEGRPPSEHPLGSARR